MFKGSIHNAAGSENTSAGSANRSHCQRRSSTAQIRPKPSATPKEYTWNMGISPTITPAAAKSRRDPVLWASRMSTTAISSSENPAKVGRWGKRFPVTAFSIKMLPAWWRV